MFTAKEVYSFAMSLYGLPALLLQPKRNCDNEVWEKIPSWRPHYVIFQDSQSTHASWAPARFWNPWELCVWLGSPPEDTNLRLQTSKAMPTWGDTQATPGPGGPDYLWKQESPAQCGGRAGGRDSAPSHWITPANSVPWFCGLPKAPVQCWGLSPPPVCLTASIWDESETLTSPGSQAM